MYPNLTILLQSAHAMASIGNVISLDIKAISQWQLNFFFEKCWGCQQHCKNLTWYSGIEIIWYKIQYMRKLVEICDMAQPISHFLIQCHAKYYTTEQATPSLQSGAMDPGGGGGGMTLLELEIFLVKRKICKIILFQHRTGPLLSQNRSLFQPLPIVILEVNFPK